MKALVYLRVSTEEQAEKGYSIYAQRTECINKAFELGCSPENILIFSDEGVSGAVLERPQLMAALNMLKNKDNDTRYFICYDSSRLSRNAAHQLIIIDEIKKSGAQLVFIKNSYQDNAEGRFQLTVMAAVDEYERARLKLRTEMGKRAKAGQHKLTHNPGLYGYEFDSRTDTLIINEEKAKILKMMFRLVSEECKGPAEIAEMLNYAGIPSPRMKQWSRVTVRRILSNPSYLGTLYIRRYDTRDYHLNKYKSKAEKVKVRERHQSEWVPVQIPGIIDRDTWEKAQKRLKKTVRKCKKRSSDDFLLSSLLKCGICGSAMNGKSVSKRDCNYRYYICSSKYDAGKKEKCRSSLVRAGGIETAVWDYVCRSICSYTGKGFDAGKIIEKCLLENENNMKNIFSKKEKAKKERERIITIFQKGYINEDELSIRLDEIEKKLRYIDMQAAEKSLYQKDFAEKLKKICREENFSFIINSMLRKIDNDGKKAVLELLVSEIVVRGSTILIRGKL